MPNTDQCILVNDRCLTTSATGVAMYLRSILESWPTDTAIQPFGYCTQRWKMRRATDHQTSDLKLQTLDQLLRHKKPSPNTVPKGRRILQRVYRKMFAREFRKGGYAAYFEPNHLAFACDGCTITTIHDLSVLEYPQFHPHDRVDRWQADLKMSLEHTDRWIAPSTFTAGRMNELLEIDPKNITVIPEAARDLPKISQSELDAWRNGHELPDQFVLHLGTLEPRKNLVVLLDAYDQLSDSLCKRCPLVLAGGVGWGDETWWRSLAQHPIAKQVLATGRVDDFAASALLAAATVVVVPSHYEGFGLPILEAMACGTPVICSDIPPFHEVGGQAASYIEPTDARAWSQILTMAIEDQDWQQAQGQAGLERNGGFSWQRAAEAHCELIDNVIAK